MVQKYTSMNSTFFVNESNGKSILGHVVQNQPIKWPENMHELYNKSYPMAQITEMMIKDILFTHFSIHILKHTIKMDTRKYIQPQDTMLASLWPAWADQQTTGSGYSKNKILILILWMYKEWALIFRFRILLDWKRREIWESNRFCDHSNIPLSYQRSRQSNNSLFMLILHNYNPFYFKYFINHPVFISPFMKKNQYI